MTAFARRGLAAFSLTLLAAAAARAQSSTWVVDEGGGGDFELLQQAIDVAAEGDVLLIKAGRYSGYFANPACLGCLSIRAKSVTLVAETGELVVLDTLSIQDLAPGQSVTLRGLLFDEVPLVATDNLGTIWLEEVTWKPTLLAIEKTAPMVELVDCAAVHLNRCTVTGAGSVPFGSLQGWTAVRSVRSGLHLYDTAVAGGAGSLGKPPGDGVRVVDGFFYASGSSLKGLVGLHLLGTQPQAITLDSALSGSPPVLVDAGSYQALSGKARHLEVEAPVRIGQAAHFHLSGQPFDFPILDVSTSPGASYDPSLGGTYQLGLPPLLTLLPGPMPISGQLTYPVPIQSFGPSVQGLTVYAQARFYSVLSPGKLALGAGTALVIVSK